MINPPWECINIFGPANVKKAPGNDGQNRISIDDFCENFKISTDVMKDGLVFIWVEKEYISQLIKCFEAQDFFYVENMCYVMLDQNKKEEIDSSRETNIDNSFVQEKSNFIHKSKKTLLIFRRMSNKKACCTLELRHQRTCDVCFDWAMVQDSSKDEAAMEK